MGPSTFQNGEHVPGERTVWVVGLALCSRAMVSQLGIKDAALYRTQGFINGKWVDAKDGGKIVVDSERIHAARPPPFRTHTAVTDPATTKEIASVPEMGLAETKEAIEAASKAFTSWSRTTAKVCTPVLYVLHPPLNVLCVPPIGAP